ncbi:unnamed protein product [Cladocopium goreaui]|uniref:Uncharacterized protein n=1 Tax=Cladocopium goreaui TaxID=2562237 RepID=A0A9P1GI91_9DINO|nr:unnamed protein product [Cladocopium goreaui]
MPSLGQVDVLSDDEGHTKSNNEAVPRVRQRGPSSLRLPARSRIFRVKVGVAHVGKHDPRHLANLIRSKCGCKSDCFQAFRSHEHQLQEWMTLRKNIAKLSKLEHDKYVYKILQAQDSTPCRGSRHLSVELLTRYKDWTNWLSFHFGHAKLKGIGGPGAPHVMRLERTKQWMSDQAWQPTTFLFLPASVAQRVQGDSPPGFMEKPVNPQSDESKSLRKYAALPQLGPAVGRSAWPTVQGSGRDSAQNEHLTAMGGPKRKAPSTGTAGSKAKASKKGNNATLSVPPDAMKLPHLRIYDDWAQENLFSVNKTLDVFLTHELRKEAIS